MAESTVKTDDGFVGDAILNDIKTAIAGSNDKIITMVKEHYVDQEVQKRVQQLVKGLDSLQAARKELAKIKPDNIVYDEDEQIISQGFSKAKLDDLGKARKKVSKLEKALSKAFDGDFSELNNLGNE